LRGAFAIARLYLLLIVFGCLSRRGFPQNKQVNEPTHGFSTFQFVPFREHEVVALKTEEHQDKISTCTFLSLPVCVVCVCVVLPTLMLTTCAGAPR
jgi:hypothetical protein